MTIRVTLSSGRAEATPNEYSLPFTEPHTTTLLIVGSFLYLLNVTHELFQFLFGAGLVGQLVLGAIYCVPLGNILTMDIQTSIGAIGYLGLLLLIVEGGLDARLDILSERKNSAICILVALFGIGLPIGFSIVVLHFGYRYAVLESFVVGAALSATSLGTTFAIMSSFRFPPPPRDPQPNVIDPGSAEPSKASKDQSNLGETRAGTILMGAALLDDIVGLVISSVVANLGSTGAESQISGWVIARPIISSVVMLFVTALLAKYISPRFIALLCSASPQDLSNNKWAHQLPNVALFLFILVVSAYVTIAHYIGSSMLIGAFCAGSLMSHSWKVIQAHTESDVIVHWSPHTSYERIAPVQNYVLAPFFFASIGAAIPVRSLFQATTTWRGVLYSAIMVIAKVLAGAWLPIWAALEQRIRPHNRTHSAPSWPAGLFVGFALVTRGEIGLLILNIAQAEGLVGEEAFGVGIWAVVLILGATLSRPGTRNVDNRMPKMRKKCDEKKPECSRCISRKVECKYAYIQPKGKGLKSRTIPGTRPQNDPDQACKPLIEGELVVESIPTAPGSILDIPVYVSDQLDRPALLPKTDAALLFNTTETMPLPPPSLAQPLSLPISHSHALLQQPKLTTTVGNQASFNNGSIIVPCSNLLEHSRFSLPVFDTDVTAEEHEGNDIDVEGIKPILFISSSLSGTTDNSSIEFVLQSYARWIPLVLFDPLKVVHKAKQLLLNQFALSTESRTRVLLIARLVHTLAKGWVLNEEGVTTLELLQDRVFNNLIGYYAHSTSDETIEQAGNALGNVLELMSIQIPTSPLSSTLRLIATAAPVFLAACPPPRPPHLLDILLSPSLDLRHFAVVDIILGVITGRITFCRYYVPWSLDLSERLLERLDSQGTEWLLGIPDQFIMLMAYMGGLREDAQERAFGYTNYGCTHTHAGFGHNPDNKTRAKEPSAWTGIIDSRVAEKLEDDLGKIRILPCESEDPALKLTRMVIQECWREVVHIYFYMALCGANAQDPRVQYAQKKYIRLVNGIKPGRHPDMFLIFPMVVAGLATTKLKDRRAIVSRIAGLPEHVNPGTLGNDIVKILVDIWTRTAMEGRPACWDDLSVACQAVTGM
ncbi:unnamed protein product [Rhizoctonia solani]|uniref:Zn(2)-C6 fungal-type domain-containing protein n=1 Tax=Rhizoctonia solani TaxID=456999 RepID=A0A8H3GDH8_9AGAM|nr:unnamed protein product [Rhizoctonia solani]